MHSSSINIFKNIIMSMGLPPFPVSGAFIGLLLLLPSFLPYETRTMRAGQQESNIERTGDEKDLKKVWCVSKKRQPSIEETCAEASWDVLRRCILRWHCH